MYNFKKQISVLDNKEIFLLFLSFIFSCVIILVEMVGISTIPILIINFLDFKQTVFNNVILKFLGSIDLKDLIVFICLLFFLKSLFTYSHAIFDFYIFKRLRISVGKKVYNNLLQKSYLKNIESPSSTKIWLINNSAIFVKLIQTYLNLFRSIIFIVAVSSIILFINFKYFVYFFIFLIIFLGTFYYFLSKKIKQFGKNYLILARNLDKVILETFEGFKNIIIYNQFKFFSEFFANTISKKENNLQSSNFISQMPSHFVEFLGVLFLCIFVLISLQNNTDQGNFIYILGLISYGSVRILSFLKLSISSLNILKEKNFVVDVICNELNLESKESSFEYNLFNQSNMYDEKNQNIISIQNLSYKYPNSDKYIIKNQNLSIKKNSFYIIRGESGQGKSTFLDILMGILKPTNGKVKLNLKNNNIGYVSQECFIFNDTIKNNIAIGLNQNQIDEIKINKILKELKLFDYFSSLEKGFDTILTSKGLNLSVGQKQRIGIARALYFEPEILFLDEPTSSLDSETSNIILKILNELSKETTIVMVSHKESLDSANKINIKLSDGNLIFEQ